MEKLVGCEKPKTTVWLDASAFQTKGLWPAKTLSRQVEGGVGPP